MSATAGLAKEYGFEVQGSDSKSIYEPARSVLETHKIPYFIGYDEANARDAKADIYVASAGEGMDNPEIKYLRDSGVEIHSLSQMLRELAKDKLRIVVAGTHGKSTTAGMLGRALQEIDDSSFMTGAVLQGDETNYHKGDGHYFVFEGDEYKSLFDDPTPKFQQYDADILILTNLEFDHPDVFENFEDMEREFEELLNRMPVDALVSYNGDNAALVKLVHNFNLGSVSFAIHNRADFTAKNISYDASGSEFDVEWNKPDGGSVTEHYRTGLVGEMNVYNALGVISTLRTLGFEQSAVQQGISSYKGIKRRFEYIGEKNGILVYDDYAHHPTAVRETLLAARARFPDQRIWAVFEPHTFSRTESTLADLSKSFIAANKVLLAEIYPAREKKTENSIKGEDVVAAISKHHSDVRLVADRQAALSILSSEAEPGDVVIVMAVGNFNLLAKELLEGL